MTIDLLFLRNEESFKRIIADLEKYAESIEIFASDKNESLSEAILLSCDENQDAQIIRTLLQVRECSNNFHNVC